VRESSWDGDGHSSLFLSLSPEHTLLYIIVRL
jgi:hypothetical protein